MRKRIMIIGQPGSGKSVLARKLGAKLGLPVYHIDHIHWQRGWKERTRTEKTKLCREVHAKDTWVFEGGHSSTWPERLDRADTLIWIDLPWWIRTVSVVYREAKSRGKRRVDLPDGCPAGFDARFIEFLRFMWKSRESHRQKAQRCYDEAAPSKECYRFSRRRDVNRFVDEL